MSLMIFSEFCSFVGFFVIVLFMLPRSSAQSALLDEVTRRRREVQNGRPRRWRSGVNADCLAKPFTLFRGLFSS